MKSFIRLIARLRTDDQVHGLIVGGAERKQQRFLEELQQKCRDLGSRRSRHFFRSSQRHARDHESVCSHL